METYTRKSVIDDLNNYDYLAKEGDYIEVTEWKNGEGYDIMIGERYYQLSHGQLEAIIYLAKTLEFKKK